MFRKSTEKINNTIDFILGDYKVILFFRKLFSEYFALFLSM